MDGEFQPKAAGVISLLGRFSSSMLRCRLLECCQGYQCSESGRFDGDSAHGRVANNRLVYVKPGDNSAKVKPRVRHAHGGADPGARLLRLRPVLAFLE